MTSTDQRPKLPGSFPRNSSLISRNQTRGEVTEVAKIGRGEAKRRGRRIDKLH